MLFGSNTLEIVIGLAFVYVLLALICSTLNEWIAGLLGLRARTLREGIANLLEDPDAKGLAKQFFEHPLVRGLARKGKRDFPSYIPASTFAAALLDIAFPQNTADAPTNMLDLYERVRAKLEELSASNNELARTLLILLNQAGVEPAQIREATLALQQVEQVRANLLVFADQLNAAQLGTLSPLADTLEKFQKLEITLKQAEDTAKVTLTHAQDNIEKYYDQAMDRVSGWYKRRAQVIVIVLAVLVTGLLNADTITIGKQLGADPVLRTKVADAATLFLQQNQEQLAASAPVTTTVPVVASTTNTETTNAISTTVVVTTPLSASTAMTPSMEISQTLATLTNLGLPLGWTELPATTEGWLYKLAGLFITIVAVSLGAPFWFELLNKLVNMRMSGAKPSSLSTQPDSRSSSVLEARLLPPGISPTAVSLAAAPQAAASAVFFPPRDALAELAASAVKYVEDLKRTRTLSAPDRDVAIAWMLVETTNRNIPASPEAIVSAIDRALKEHP
jgi:hypothetical protein